MQRLRKPFDAHLHLRDGPVLEAVLPDTVRTCAGAIVMPNLVPPVTTPALARAYRARILAALPEGATFAPHVTAYLTDDADPDALVAGHAAGDWIAAKLYPAHATTHSARGVTDWRRTVPALRAMAEVGMPLCVHGEVTDPAVDIFDREAAFLHEVLAPLLELVPDLRVVFEHATTKAAVDFVAGAGDRVGMTITAHHLWWSRNALFDGGLRPHAYCLPVLKRERDRLALIEAATGHSPRVFFGSDSAPHLQAHKECDHGCAGVYSAPSAVEAVLTLFRDAGALDRAEAFLSLRGPAWYGLAPSDRWLTVTEGFVPPAARHTADGPVVVFLGGEALPFGLRAD